MKLEIRLRICVRKCQNKTKRNGINKMQRPTCRCRITSNCGIRWDRWGDSGPGQPAAASIGLPPASSGLPPASIGLPPAFPRPPAAFPGPPSAAGPGSRAGTIRLSAAFHRCGCACGEFRPFHRPNSRCAPAIKVAIGGISSGRAPDMATWHFPRRLIMLAFIVQLSATINSIIPTRLLCQSFIFFFSFLYIVINFDDFNLVIDCTYFQYD